MIKILIVGPFLLAVTPAAAQVQGEGGTEIAAYYALRVAHIQLEGQLFDGTVEPAMQGSGFLLDDRHVLTANHVADTGTKYKKVEVIVRLGSRKKDGIKATVVARDPANDLALIELATPTAPTPYCPVSALMPPALLPMGSALYVLGYPMSRDISQTPGIVSNNYGDDLLQTNAVINPGNSGGPVFSSRGYLVAVVEQTATGATMPNGEQIDVHGLTDLIPIGRLVGSPVGAWLKAHSTAGCWREATSLPSATQFAWTSDPAPASAGIGGGLQYPPNNSGASYGIGGVISAPPTSGQTKSRPPLPARLSVDHSITELKDDHSFKASRLDYQKVLVAERDYLIDECAIEVQSKAHAEDLRCTVASDGQSASVSFGLTSGPALDRWRGWLRATVSLGQQRRTDPTAAPPALRSTRRLPVSQYKTDHKFEVSSRTFSQHFAALPGKRIVDCGIEQTSANHADAIVCGVDPAGAGATLTFRLRSGPFYSQWRGWLNGEVVLGEVAAP